MELKRERARLIYKFVNQNTLKQKIHQLEPLKKDFYKSKYNFKCDKMQSITNYNKKVINLNNFGNKSVYRSFD